MRLDSVKACPFCGAKSVSIRKISTCYRAKCNNCEATAAGIEQISKGKE